MQLQLADHNQHSMSHNYAMAAQNTMEAYIFIPGAGDGSGAYFREDMFDDLSTEEFDAFIQAVEPFQPGMSLLGIFGKKARERREERQGKREITREKKATEKQKRIETRGKSGGGFFNKLGGLIGKIKGTDVGTYTEPMPGMPEAAPGEPLPPAKKGMPMWGWIAIAGVSLFVVGGVVIATKKKKRG